MVKAMRQGQVPMAIEALADSYSIFNYLAAAHLRLPAEKGDFLPPSLPSRTASVLSHWLIHMGGHT